MIYHYQAFNLSIRSDLPFPELLAFPSSQAQICSDITIKFGDVSPHGLDATAQTTGLFYQATEYALWLHIPNIARFLITNGNQIIIQPIAEACHDSIRVFILGSCIGALLMQRNLFLLHGNAVKIGQNCISFVGHSGAGKSTLSGAFFKRGHSILADDVCAVNAEGHVIPSFPQIKLWFDAAKHLTIDTKPLRRIRPLIEKFAVPLEHQFYQQTLPLKVVYVLQAHNKDTFNFTNITGMQKLQPLQNNTYRKNYLKGLGKDQNHFKQCSRIANQISVVRIARPQDGFQLDKLVDLIQHDLAQRGLPHAS